MTATAAREVGLPWFDRHATKGGKEIFAFSRTFEGGPIRPRIRSGTWPNAEAIRTFYDEFKDLRPEGFPLLIPRGHELGYVGGPEFDTWEAAEAWLMAP